MSQPVLPSSPLVPANTTNVQTYQPKPSLSLLYKQHRDVQEIRRVQNGTQGNIAVFVLTHSLSPPLSEVKRKAVMEAVAKVSESMMDGINYGVARVFANQKKIDAVRLLAPISFLAHTGPRKRSNLSSKRKDLPKLLRSG